MALVKNSLKRRLAWRVAAWPIVGPQLIGSHLRKKYGASVVTPLKVRNFIDAHDDHRRRATSVSSLPFILNLDTVNACNLRCPFCATGVNQMHRKKSKIGLPVAKSVIDAVRGHVLEVRFFNWGEPFLNPEIFELIAHAKASGIYSNISSNMSVKVDDFGEQVVRSGLNYLRISLDGVEQKTLEQYRRRADFDLIVKNIRSIVDAKRRLGSDTPRIEAVFLVFRHNEHELDKLESLRAEWGIDAFTPSPAFVYANSFVPEHRSFQPIQTMFESSCQYLYFELMIEADGNISPCCTNTDSRFDIGSVQDVQDLKRFWNSPVMQTMRAVGSPLHGDVAGAEDTLCNHCYLIGRGAAPVGALSPLPPAMVADNETLPPV